ncbi:MAG: ABC transporter substrate-binding protein, partial [Oscillospiraceae bacterium]|nr:ABC transporter substrate-binding protein [Oscillospiraceae bacterium]
MKIRNILALLLAAVLLCAAFAGCARTETPNEPANDTPATDPESGGTPDTPDTPDTGDKPANAGEESEGETAAGNPDVVSQGVTDDTIKIGTAALLGGAWAYIGIPAYDGLRACIARLNAQGGVMGRQIELLVQDDQYDAATGKAVIERYVEQDQVFMLASLGGNIVEPSLQYLRDKGIPVVNISSGLDVCYSENDPNGNIFQVQPANMTDARYLIARVLHESIFGPNKDQKLPDDAKIAVVHGTDSASLNSLEYLKEFAEGEGALDRLVMEAVTQDTYATAIQKFKNEDCQIVIFMGIDATVWISAMDDAQYEVPVVFSYGASTLQSFVPDTYKPTRPCYATVWGDYSG